MSAVSAVSAVRAVRANRPTTAAFHSTTAAEPPGCLFIEISTQHAGAAIQEPPASLLGSAPSAALAVGRGSRPAFTPTNFPFLGRDARLLSCLVSSCVCWPRRRLVYTAPESVQRQHVGAAAPCWPQSPDRVPGARMRRRGSRARGVSGHGVRQEMGRAGQGCIMTSIVSVRPVPLPWPGHVPPQEKGARTGEEMKGASVRGLSPCFHLRFPRRYACFAMCPMCPVCPIKPSRSCPVPCIVFPRPVYPGHGAPPSVLSPLALGPFCGRLWTAVAAVDRLLCRRPSNNAGHRLAVLLLCTPLFALLCPRFKGEKGRGGPDRRLRKAKGQPRRPSTTPSWAQWSAGRSCLGVVERHGGGQPV